MMVRVHHSSDEVGDTCVEIEHQGDRLVLNVGASGTPARAGHAALSTVLARDDGSHSRLRASF